MSKDKIITASLIIIFVLAFYFLTKKPSSIENQISNTTPTSNPMPTLPPSKVTELKIEDIKVGTGSAVKSGDTVSINYLGTLEDGTKFDSSYDRNQPFETQIGVGQVIEGWDKGVVGMQVGGKRKLSIPYQMAYGENGYGPIPAKATLIFEVELMAIK
ncbi:MAG: FKBP-type peptidyl-prolyl cis-trans isomerase [Candidatus Shapirobacteria bacterium]|nr:FKBP-type peptidyl-prolyl cis-trans isomerase [Candidatus Shapirobacteria bacterium]MDD3003125.1 FKBP-type peptidyl-prolyl cis-trans isomerase [Candidatus Shapirobacteria bacterium]MDD4383183.1 FKBP-type peptidyl-prolyl cis-trans isomerase [Candidatus Shapirobacteria bacterium]